MKNLKKLISVVLCIAMVASLLTINVSAVSYGDVDETKSYYAAVELLSALDILKGDDEGNFNPDADIKRSEFAAVVCRALGQENAATSTASMFDDVSSDHWAVGYITWAAGKGIVNGYGDGTFGPDNTIKYQEALKMLAVALGYAPLAEDKGGYPYGYIAVAGTYGISAGLSVGAETAASRAVVAQLTYNALEAPIMDTSYYTTTGEQRYIVYDGSKAADYEERTILSYYLDIIKVKATVAETYKVNEQLWKKNQPEKVKLDFTKIYNETDKEEYADYLYTYSGGNTYYATGVSVLVGDTNASDYLAESVMAYMFLNDDDDLELKAIVADGKSTESLTVTKDIVTADLSAAGVATFTYWEDIENDNKVTEVDIAANAMVYVNGKQVGALTAGSDAETAFEAATSASIVEFVGPKNGDYDRIFITNYSYEQVTSIDLEDEYVVFDSGAIELSKDARGDSFKYTIYKNGEVIGLEDLKEGDVLSIVAPGGDYDDSAYVDIYVTDETITGTVTGAKSTDPYTFYIDKVEYKTVNANELTVGDTGTFYLTADGKILYGEAETSVSDNYAFILKADYTTTFGEKTWQVRLFTKDGAIETYNVASTLKVTQWNGTKNIETSYKRANNGQDAILDSIKTITTTVDSAAATTYANAMSRLITYTVSGGEISKIAIAATNVGTNDLRKAYNVDDLTNASYRAAVNRIGVYTATDASKLFYAPISEVFGDEDNDATTPDTVIGYTIDEDDVALMSTSGLDEETSYDGYVYNANSDREFGAAVITSDLGFAGKTNALAVVTEVSSGLNSEGTIADQITVVQGGTEATYVVDEDIDNFDADDLDVGDIIQFVLNGKDEISQAMVVFCVDEGTYGKLSNDALAENSGSGDTKYVYGIFAELNGKSIALTDNFASKFDTTYAPEIYTFNYEEGCTIAKVDYNKINTNNAVTAATALSSLRATKAETLAKWQSANNSDTYLIVARIYKEDAVDAVTYQLLKNTNGTAVDGASADFTITY